MIASTPPAQRFAADTRDAFSLLVDRATGCVIDRKGGPMNLDLIVDGAVYRFEFDSDKDLRLALELVKACRLPLSDHGALVRLLTISIGGGLALLVIFAAVFQGA